MQFSSNWNQKQFVDKNTPIALHEAWVKVPAKTPNKIYQIEGHTYKVVDKRERHLPLFSAERISKIFLGILLFIGSLGLALLSKQVKQLFTGRQVQRVLEEFIPDAKKPKISKSPATIDVPKVDHLRGGSPKKAKAFSPTDQARASLYKNAPAYPQSAVSKPYEVMSDHGGAANVVNRVIQKNPDAKCAVMICANSGLPCGKVGADGYANQATLNCTTQEESILANVLLTQFGDDKAKHKEFLDQTFTGVWGMVDGPVGHSTMTHQGIDFTTRKDASAYNQTYVLNSCQLGVTTGTGSHKTLVPGQKNEVTLIFADSINANPSIGSATGTMKRTLNQKAINDYPFFRECIKTKLRSSLDAMVAEGNTHAIVGRLSCGIYAPDKWKTDPTNINKDFYNILLEVLNEKVGPNGEERRRYFREVIIPALPPK